MPKWNEFPIFIGESKRENSFHIHTLLLQLSV